MRVFGYTRVSTPSQVENGSLDYQAEVIKEYCKDYGHSLVRLYSDAGISGGKILQKRPQGKILINDEFKEPYRLPIIVAYQDRLTRNSEDTRFLIKNYIKIIEVLGYIDKDNPMYRNCVFMTNQIKSCFKKVFPINMWDGAWAMASRDAEFQLALYDSIVEIGGVEEQTVFHLIKKWKDRFSNEFDDGFGPIDTEIEMNIQQHLKVA